MTPVSVEKANWDRDQSNRDGDITTGTVTAIGTVTQQMGR